LQLHFDSIEEIAQNLCTTEIVDSSTQVEAEEITEQQIKEAKIPKNRRKRNHC
jgi:hypothetical protein